MTRRSTTRRTTRRTTLGRALTAAVGAAAALGAVLAAPSAAGAAACSDVELVVARGTSEPGTLGIVVGDNVLAETRRALPGRDVTAYAVDYPAGFDPTSPGLGVVDTVEHVTAQAAACPAQRFVLVGYSQGAQVIDGALGVDTTGTINGGPPPAVIPADVAPRIAAVTNFGNPITAVGKTVPAEYLSRTLDVCRSGDPVCDADGVDILAHLLYFLDAPAAARFVAGKV
jgi:cutinase